jgi:hypothetical protein
VVSSAFFGGGISPPSVLDKTRYGTGGSEGDQKKDLEMKNRLLIAGSIICVLASALFVACRIPATTETEESFRRQAMLTFQPRIAAAMQKEFNRFHPLGTAKGIQIDDVTFQWKAGVPTLKKEDIEQVTTTFTLYWTSPLTKDGWTVIREVFDMKSKKLVSVKLLKTNGVTNGDLLESCADPKPLAFSSQS